MPVFECARCNAMTYSASRFADLVCDRCGAARHRALDQAFSFDEARAAPRSLAPGDHCCLAFDAPEEVAGLCVRIVRTALGEGARVIAHPPARLRAAVEASLEPDEVAAVEWADPLDLYTDGFEPEAVVAHFRQLAESEPRQVYVVGGPGAALGAVTTRADFERFERLITEGTTDTGMIVVCLYDRPTLGEAYAAVGQVTHPLMGADDVRRNERFAYASAESSPSST